MWEKGREDEGPGGLYTRGGKLMVSRWKDRELGPVRKKTIIARGPQEAYPPPALENLGWGWGRQRTEGVTVLVGVRGHCALWKA